LIENQKNEKHKEALHTSNDETSVHSVYAYTKHVVTSYVLVGIIVVITPKFALYIYIR
jgi:hypothetical protein